MNHATQFYNIINVAHNQRDIFSIEIKEFNPLIRNHIFLPEAKFTSSVFIDDSALIALNGEIHITKEKQEFLTYIIDLLDTYPDLKRNFIEHFDSI